MYVKYIILICLIYYYISTVNSMDEEVSNEEEEPEESKVSASCNGFSFGRFGCWWSAPIKTKRQKLFNKIERFSNSLKQATVANWNSLIPQPSEDLQNIVKEALVESQCPPHILKHLIHNCYENNWPSGLSTEFDRQRYESSILQNYKCKRVPGQQAVIVFSFDNNNAPYYVMAEPALLFIFTDGVETVKDSV